jgi:hypothetical protein
LLVEGELRVGVVELRGPVTLKKMLFSVFYVTEKA